jgi:hypothetical protein
MRAQPPCTAPCGKTRSLPGLTGRPIRQLRSKDFVRACGDNFARRHRMSGWVYRHPSPAGGLASARIRRRIPQGLLRVLTILPGTCLRTDSMLSHFRKRTCLLSVRRIPGGRFLTRSAGWLAAQTCGCHTGARKETPPHTCWPRQPSRRAGSPLTGCRPAEPPPQPQRQAPGRRRRAARKAGPGPGPRPPGAIWKAGRRSPRPGS